MPVADALVRLVCPDTVSVVAVVEARVEVPETVSVPSEVIDEVAVMTPPVRLAIVAFVVVELPTTRLVMLARVAIRLEKNPDCAVIPVPDAVLKLVCPEV